MSGTDAPLVGIPSYLRGPESFLVGQSLDNTVYSMDIKAHGPGLFCTVAQWEQGVSLQGMSDT